jgi:hypothetical protein
MSKNYGSNWIWVWHILSFEEKKVLEKKKSILIKMVIAMVSGTL